MNRVARAGVGTAILASASVVAGIAIPGSGSAHQPTASERRLTGLHLEPAAQHVSRLGVPKLRVLLTGDSITQGFNGDYTWRFRLWQEFKRQGVPVNFVGSRHLPYVASGFDTAAYADPHFDTDHFAVTGTMLSSLATRLRAEVASQRPDVVVLEAGVNDLLHGRTPEQTDAALRLAIAGARAAAPDVKIVICPVLGVQRSRPSDIRAEIRSYDGLARATVAELSTPSSPIVMAHTRDDWSVEDDTYAGLHPNPTGESLIADQVALALQDLGVLAEQPAPARVDVWHRDLLPVAAVTGGRALLSWDTQAITGARLRWREAGGAWRVVPAVLTQGHFSTRLLTPGATYEFQLQAIRKRMVSPYGPLSTLQIPVSDPIAVP